MNIILTAVVAVTVIGVVCAVVLCVISKAMAVPVDERVEKMLGCLPGSNCGACGFPGCAGYAAALASDSNVKTNLCTPGGKAAVDALSAIMGVEAGELIKKIAVVHCRGDCNVEQKKMEYNGINTCAAAKMLYGGDGACAYGCLGYGDCQPVCAYDAICIVDGLARINTEKCTGCGLCVSICPNKLITVDDAQEATVIQCNSLDKGAAARKKCANACIACRKCVRECPAQAIAVEDNLARIDYEKCTGCHHCAETCVTHSIQNFCEKEMKAG